MKHVTEKDITTADLARLAKLAQMLPAGFGRACRVLLPAFSEGASSVALREGFEGVSVVVPFAEGPEPVGTLIAMWVPEGADAMANLRAVLGLEAEPDTDDAWFGNAHLTVQ